MMQTVTNPGEDKATTRQLEWASLRSSRVMLSALLGNKWSLLVLDEAFRGTTRFRRFQERLGITPKTLIRSLKALVELGMLSRCAYSDSPARWEYLLTDEGETIRPALGALSAWGEQHTKRMSEEANQASISPHARAMSRGTPSCSVLQRVAPAVDSDAALSVSAKH
jgi:DNA-binding HxlR family transcriptional regulator